jgi:hypothetical protein
MPEPRDPHDKTRVYVSSAEDTLRASRTEPIDFSAQQKQPDAEAGRYAHRGEIGRGGMGAVERVVDRVLMRTVAMKTMLLAEAATGADRFVEEAQITGQLDHPNVVPVYDLGRTREDGGVFFTMKLVSGRTLTERIHMLHEDGFPHEDLEELVAALVKVCEAVAFAHSRGVIHCDLKPGNIMIGTHGQVYVMDWGLSILRPDASTAKVGAVRTARPPRKREGGVQGTASYMAPEQAIGRLDLVDERSDVFALGGILYEMITSRPPYEGLTYEMCLAAAREATVVPPAAFCQHPIPPILSEIAMRAMQADPAQRHPCVEAFAADLTSFLRGGGWFATLQAHDGDIVLREGDPAHEAYVIVEGKCEVFRERDGRRTVLRTLGPGDAFGETALLSARPRTASVMAVGNVTLKLITAEAFERELGRSAWLLALVKQLAERFVELDQVRSGDI